MGYKGFLGFLIIAAFAILWGVFFGPGKISEMEQAIQSDLNDAGYSNFVKAEMSGNVVTLTGKAPSEAVVIDAVNIANANPFYVFWGKRC